MSKNSKLKDHKLYLTGEIDESSANTLIKELLELQDKPNKVESVTLYLNTLGGCARQGLAICNVIKHSPFAINCIAYGCVASMGIYIMSACTSVSAYPDTTFLIHNISHDINHVTNQELKGFLIDRNTLAYKINKMLYTNRLEIDKELYEEKLKSNMDWMFYAEDALKLKYIDSIIGQ